MGDHQKLYYRNILETLENVFVTQQNAIEQAASIFADTVRHQGIIYGFGSGHSFAAGVELAGRAGGLVNTRALDQFYGHMGWLDGVAGCGDVFSRLIDLREHDCFVIVSNSGTKPLHVELARNIHARGNKVIAITGGQNPVDLPSEGINKYADVTINNASPKQDCTLSMDNDRIMTGPVSSISNAYIINSIVIECIDVLLAAGITPPIMRSINQPGGKEYNDSLLAQYRERVFTV